MSGGARFDRSLAEFQAKFVHDMIADCVEKWCVAGSLRRESLFCGDVEHAIVPRFEAGGLFGTERRNLLLERLDQLVADGRLAKAVKSNGTRWGDRYRAVTLPGGGAGSAMHHELFMGDRDNWGSLLCIRTGPSEFSTLVVARLREHGYCNHEGYVRRLVRRPSPAGGYVDDHGEVVPVATEAEYLALAEMRYIEPRQRQAVAEGAWRARRMTAGAGGGA